MPRIEKLVPVDGRLGVVLDIPLEQFGVGSVSIYTQQEVDYMLKAARGSEQEAIIQRIIERVSKAGKCPTCMAWECAKSVAETIRSE